MQRRQVLRPTRRSRSFSFARTLCGKAKSPTLLSFFIVLLGAFLLVTYTYSGSVLFKIRPYATTPPYCSMYVSVSVDEKTMRKKAEDFFVSDKRTRNKVEDKGALGNKNAAKSTVEDVFAHEKRVRSKVEGDQLWCTSEVEKAIPALKKAYGNSMNKVLHVGPNTCSVVSQLLKEKETEAWGIEPNSIEDVTDLECKSLVHKGKIRVADNKYPLPYTAKAFSLVIVSDALDYLSRKSLNHTLEWARVSADGLVIFTGRPGQQRKEAAELLKFGRLAKTRSFAWWMRYFFVSGLKENEAAANKFEQAAHEISYKPSCQVMHLNPYH